VPDVVELQVGMSVVVHGLKGAAAAGLNGEEGTLEKFDAEKQRWHVRLWSTNKVKALKADNLMENAEMAMAEEEEAGEWLKVETESNSRAAQEAEAQARQRQEEEQRERELEERKKAEETAKVAKAAKEAAKAAKEAEDAAIRADLPNAEDLLKALDAQEREDAVEVPNIDEVLAQLEQDEQEEADLDRAEVERQEFFSLSTASTLAMPAEKPWWQDTPTLRLDGPKFNFEAASRLGRVAYAQQHEEKDEEGRPINPMTVPAPKNFFKSRPGFASRLSGPIKHARARVPRG